MGKGHFQLSKSQRMQMKAFICVLGLLLLFILLLGRLFLGGIHREEPKKEDPKKEHIPIIQLHTNVWIMEADREKLLVFRDGVEETYYLDTTRIVGEAQEKLYTPEHFREQIADITLADGKVTDIDVKIEKISGKVLSADEESVELEGYGRVSLAEDYKGYRIYNSLEMCTASDISIGYEFTDFVIEDGKICSILMVREEAMQNIRVLIKASDYAKTLHEQVVVTCDTDFTIEYGAHDAIQTQKHTAGEEIQIAKDSAYFSGERLRVIPDVLTGKVCLKSVNRSQGIPSYRGHIEMVATEDGIAVINEVSLEEYLYCVVPSEMPASYPEEALKAQAICARTYAYGHMQKAGYPQYGAHVDDSTSYQVYNNILEQESTTTAVKETYGQLLFTEEGTLAGTYYYSTSCGIGTDATIWKTEAAKDITYLGSRNVNQADMLSFVQGELEAASMLGEQLREEESFADFIYNKREGDFEAKEGWYRWCYQVEELDTEHMLSVLQKRYEVNSRLVLTLEGEEYVSKPIVELSELVDLYIEKRGSGGIADELILKTKENTYKVISEHNIRYVLNNGVSKVIRQDGSQIASPSLLPSGFLVIEPVRNSQCITGYTLSGGGFGHGVGMSQNGARSMAKSGYHSEQILLFFYEKCFIKNVYE